MWSWVPWSRAMVCRIQVRVRATGYGSLVPIKVRVTGYGSLVHGPDHGIR